MKKKLALFSLVVGTLFLSGCTTEEFRQKEEIKDGLNFSDLEKAAAQKGQVAKEAAATPKPKEPPVSQSVTKKSMYSYPPMMSIDPAKKYTAKLETSAGVITVSLTAKETPMTVNNFVFLARQKFYDGTIFHRTIPGFMIQGGDPEGTGMGGPGYRFDDEPFTGKYERGVVAMANAGPNTNGSQFFIMHKDYPLPPNYVIFGKVTEGLEAVDAIAEAPTEPGGEGSKPVTPVVVANITITEE